MIKSSVERLGAANLEQEGWNRAAVDHILLNTVILGRCMNTDRHILMLAGVDMSCRNGLLSFELIVIILFLFISLQLYLNRWQVQFQ